MNLEIDAYIPAEGGYFVSERHARIAEILHDYDPTIELAWVPPDKREPGDMPFAVMKTEDNGARYIICFADETTCDERLLARVWSMDSVKQGNILDKIDAHNAAVEAVKLKKQMEQMEEANDLAYSILKSPKHAYKHNGIRFDRMKQNER